MMTALRTEADVTAKLLFPLFENTLGYLTTDIDLGRRVQVTFGRETKTKFADIVISHNRSPVIAVEAKTPTEAVESGIGQVDSYAFALGARFSVVTNGQHLLLRGYYSGNRKITVVDESVSELRKARWSPLKNLISAKNIALAMDEQANPEPIPDEVKIKDYRRFFRKIHNLIRNRGKLNPGDAFDELSKLLFLKAAEDERTRIDPKKPFLTPDRIEEWEALGNAPEMINKWFQKAVTGQFPDVFDDHPQIRLSPATLKEVIVEIKPFHVRNGDMDVKGRAFEEFLPSQLRGKGLGQYFTPRPIVNFMAALADISIHDVVVDFSCGSGGFLIKAFEYMQSRIEQLPAGTLRRLNWTKENLLEDIKSHQIYGIDAEHRAARTAKMNMLMWGDGKRVVQGNALGTLDDHGKPLEPAEYDPETPQSGCTLILANPPFGSKEESQDILSHYRLGSKYQERKSEKTEVLFLEKGMKLLRPEGKMLIVLPQGILSAISHDRVRDYLHSEAEIRAVISLPTHAFVQSGVSTVNTCVLYLQKFTKEKKAIYDAKTLGLNQSEVRDMLRADPDFDYPIFMGTAEFIGYEPSGRMIAKPGEQTDLDLLLADFANQSDVTQPDIDVFSFADRHYGAKAYRRKDQTIQGTEKGLKTSFVVRLSNTTDRLDPPFLFQSIQAGAVLESLTPLKGTIRESGVTFRAKTDDELDAEYPTLSVSSDGKLSTSGYLKGEDFTQRYTRVATGDIVYNPSRINIGSIGLVKASMDGSYVSPEYVVFRSSGLTPEFLIHLLRSPFYKMYIDVVTTGSIRDRLYFGDLEDIRVPRVSLEDQNEICNESEVTESTISKKNVTTSGATRRTINRIYEFIDSSRTVQSHFDNSPPELAPSTAVADFHLLAEQWKNETRLWPTVTKRCIHPAYQRIIGMGAPIVPSILADLKQNGPNDWFWALTAITGENPIAESISGDMGRMTEAWLAWGSRMGYLRDSRRKTSENSLAFSEAVTE